VQGKLLGSDLRAEVLPLGDGCQIANQARITQLAFAGGQVLVAPVAHVGNAMIQQFFGRCGGAAQALDKDCDDPIESQSPTASLSVPWDYPNPGCRWECLFHRRRPWLPLCR